MTYDQLRAAAMGCFCKEGWICEAHPDKGWPHDDCAGPGMPCPNTLPTCSIWRNAYVGGAPGILTKLEQSA